MSGGLAVAVRELRHLPAVWRAPHRAPERTRALALEGVNALLRHCRERVPAFADYPAGPLASLDELAGLPILTKRAVLDAGVESFHAQGLAAGAYRTDVTSGTTGTRLHIRHDVDAYGYHGATVLRRFLLSGYRPWWRIAHIKPFPRPVRWFQRLGLFPRVVVPAGQSDAAIARAVLAVRPQLIMGYPVVLRGLLRALDPGELARLRRGLKLVMTDSELLTDEVAAQFTERFGVPVYDEYSAYEVLTVSSGCAAGAMHVDEDRVWLEIVDEAGTPVPEGVTGSVVVTHFRERAMPLPRYQLGDRAHVLPAGCPCGSRFRRMRLVDGRTNDFVTLPGGRRVYSGVFLALAMHTPGVAECMVRQDEAGEVTVHLVPEAAGEAAFAAACVAFEQALGEAVDAPVVPRFVRAERIALTPGGKGRFVESAYRPGVTGPRAERG
ncbi:phenylacetate--CoA ligase family protein [Micromonospora sp. WMMD730]|uniref:phenylacetate--CoA ligase family protein n=1 Tax=Micromonospora sp. WMMD730 TaxID=3404128 RepID=UPI003B93DBAB